MVITNSEKPVVVSIWDPSQDYCYTFFVKVQTILTNLLDSNAAGDSFVGGFLAKICYIEATNIE